MARILVQLKLRLLFNALRSTTGTKVSFVLSSAAAVLVAIGTFVSLAALGHNGAAVDLTAVIYTTVAFGWLILPLISFGLDSTLDPATLALYPLRMGPLIAGLLAASATGVWPAANLIGALGITVGLAHGALAIVIAVLAAILQVLFCITLARCVTTALAGLLRSRRGRDLAALAIIPIFGLYETFAQVLPKAVANHEITAASFAGVDAWLRWLPPGLAAHAVQDAATGHAGTAVARLALLLVIIAVLGVLWARALGHALVTADTSSHGSAVRGGALPFGRARSTRAPGPARTVAARVWIYQRRDPTALISWGITLIIMVVVAISTLRGHHPLIGVLLSAGFGGAFTGVLHDNAIGLTGPAFYTDALALSGRRQLRGWFLGHDVVFAAFGVPLVLVVPLVLAVISGHPANGLLAIALGLAAVGAGLGVSNVFSAAVPWPAERRPGSPTPRPIDGYTGHTLTSRLGTLIGTATCIAPVIAAIAATGSVPAATRMPALIAGAVVYGALLAGAGITIAARVAHGKIPELYQLAARTRL